MRTKKQIEKMMIGMLLGGGCLLSSCHSVHMSAEDRLQGDYQEAAAEVELETVEELTAFAYNDVSVIPYTVENIARGFTDLSDEEIEKYKVCDEHEIKSLTVPEENTKIQLDFGDISFCSVDIVLQRFMDSSFFLILHRLPFFSVLYCVFLARSMVLQKSTVLFFF
jgi:hypothetical protein